jgi:hypothetical protein
MKVQQVLILIKLVNSIHMNETQETPVNERYVYIMMLLFYSHTILTY